MLNVSIVLYFPDWNQIDSLTNTLLQSDSVAKVYWIDNSPVAAQSLPLQSQRVCYQHNPSNIGYGAAHNIAIRESIYDNIPFHLVINPDILMDNCNIFANFFLRHGMSLEEDFFLHHG